MIPRNNSEPSSYITHWSPSSQSTDTRLWLSPSSSISVILTFLGAAPFLPPQVIVSKHSETSYPTVPLIIINWIISTSLLRCRNGQDLPRINEIRISTNHRFIGIINNRIFSSTSIKFLGNVPQAVPFYHRICLSA